ncbi:MAG TPA: histone deacetylase family protein [Alphaproteobacteria bacterium]|nr:histone deacetylase family protein [Alphaproteobacteria bacterium]
MHTILFTHPSCLEHDTGLGHPERIDRLRAVLAALEAEEFMLLDRREAPAATHEQLLRVHDAGYVDSVFARLPAHGHGALDGDTVVCAASGEAALRAAGAAVAAVDAVLGGEARNAFCAVRPPGHHAEPAQAMGFCLFNNVAVGAAHARTVHGLKRVAVIDFDVHHGNGTQAMFWDEPELMYCSTHQWPLYPGTGHAAETGVRGNIVNAPLPAFADGAAFRAAMEGTVLPALDAFAPELVMISAGFDAHARDPLAGLNLGEDDFAWATQALLDIARRHSGGRLVSVLEGGYDLQALARSTAAHVRELMAG